MCKPYHVIGDIGSAVASMISGCWAQELSFSAIYYIQRWQNLPRTGQSETSIKHYCKYREKCPNNNFLNFLYNFTVHTKNQIIILKNLPMNRKTVVNKVSQSRRSNNVSLFLLWGFWSKFGIFKCFKVCLKFCSISSVLAMTID